jgi:hypothetical protein
MRKKGGMYGGIGSDRASGMQQLVVRKSCGGGNSFVVHGDSLEKLSRRRRRILESDDSFVLIPRKDRKRYCEQSGCG